jgi:hypothetical protein
MSLLLNEVTMNESELKEILTKIKSGEKNWDDVDENIIVTSMVKHIGSTDGELRDQLIYTCFYRLIIENNQLEADLLKELLDTCLSERLFKGIGEKETDTVFTRAFTTLLMALILYRDNEDDFLPADKIHEVKESLLRYINLEEDVRGYVSGKGWAHTVAHAADTFDELIKSPKVSAENFPEILNALWKKVLVSDSAYIHDEDERLLLPIIEMMDRGLEVHQIDQLIQRLPTDLQTQKEQLENEKYWILVFNCKTFLKSFFIKLSRNSESLSLQRSIEQCLAKIY